MSLIVVGVDGSLGSLKALNWALAEARLREATLRLVHAWMVPLIDAIPEPWAVGTPVIGPTDDEVFEHLETAARNVLSASVDHARSTEPGLDVQGELVEGRAAGVLVDAAGEADLLVVGSRGRGGFAGLLLGSVSAQCVQHAPCPVVVVPVGQSL